MPEPLSELGFQELMQAGHGRAIVYAQEHDVSEFRDVILDACLQCYALEPSFEGTRADYMWELVQRTPDREFYDEHVIESLRSGGDDWSAAQRFHLAARMALAGNDQARRAVYDNFKPGPQHGGRIARDLLLLGGLLELPLAAAKVGELLLHSPDEVKHGMLWFDATERFGEAAAREALTKASTTDARIAAFLAAVEAESARDYRNTNMGLTYAELRPLFSGLSAQRLRAWGAKASPHELEAAARALVATDDPEDQLRHLRIFARRPFPFEPSVLLRLARSSETELAEAACLAASPICHPAVRVLALTLIADHRPGREWAIAMLNENVEPGDHALALHWFASEPDRHARHRLGIHLESFWERYPKPELEVEMLETVYRRGPCCFCRTDTVERLIELGALSPEMRKECAHEAGDEVRELVLPLL
jgi:hypothetical protein